MKSHPARGRGSTIPGRWGMGSGVAAANGGCTLHIGSGARYWRVLRRLGTMQDRVREADAKPLLRRR